MNVKLNDSDGNLVRRLQDGFGRDAQRPIDPRLVSRLEQRVARLHRIDDRYAAVRLSEFVQSHALDGVLA